MIDLSNEITSLDLMWLDSSESEPFHLRLHWGGFMDLGICQCYLGAFMPLEVG